MESPFIHVQRMDSNRLMLLSGVILFAMGLVIGIAIGSATAVSALTQGAPMCSRAGRGWWPCPESVQVSARARGCSSDVALWSFSLVMRSSRLKNSPVEFEK